MQCFDALSGESVDEIPSDALRFELDAARRCLIGPGFFDPQVNGFAGVDFQNPELTLEQFESAAAALLREGCVHFFPTLITASPDAIARQLALFARHVASSRLLRAMVPGFHLEGPFLSPEPGYFGCHPFAELRQPDLALLECWLAASGGLLKMITLAPELPGAPEFIRFAAARGLCVCLGHANASLEELRLAVDAGASLFTHLGNACPLQLPRHDNIIQRVLAVPGLSASLIPDGIHLPPFVLGNLYRGLGAGRAIFTTDAMSAAASSAELHRFGRLELRKGADGVVRQPGGGGFAGSSLTPLQGFHLAVRRGGLGHSEAWLAWTNLRNRLFPHLSPPLIAIGIAD